MTFEPSEPPPVTGGAPLVVGAGVVGAVVGAVVLVGVVVVNMRAVTAATGAHRQPPAATVAP